MEQCHLRCNTAGTETKFSGLGLFSFNFSLVRFLSSQSPELLPTSDEHPKSFNPFSDHFLSLSRHSNVTATTSLSPPPPHSLSPLSLLPIPPPSFNHHQHHLLLHLHPYLPNRPRLRQRPASHQSNLFPHAPPPPSNPENPKNPPRGQRQRGPLQRHHLPGRRRVVLCEAGGLRRGHRGVGHHVQLESKLVLFVYYLGRARQDFGSWLCFCSGIFVKSFGFFVFCGVFVF